MTQLTMANNEINKTKANENERMQAHSGHSMAQLMTVPNYSSMQINSPLHTLSQQQQTEPNRTPATLNESDQSSDA